MPAEQAAIVLHLHAEPCQHLLLLAVIKLLVQAQAIHTHVLLLPEQNLINGQLQVMLPLAELPTALL